MLIRYLMFVLACPVAAGLFTASALAQETNSRWRPLIGTDSLAGWSGDLDSWVVKDAVLIGRTDGSLRANRFIVADIPPVKNFEILVDVWISNRGNSGIQYRSNQREDLGRDVVTGYQCDVVAAIPQYNGMLYEERGRRILCYTGQKAIVDSGGQPWVVGSMPVQNFEPESWHTYRVLVRGNHHRHWIDDQPTAEVIDLDQSDRSLSGVIGVQVHVGPPMEVRYRNFRLRRLPDDLPLRTTRDTPIPQSAQRVVPQGGWEQQGRRDANARLENISEDLLPSGHLAGHVELAAQPTPQQIRLLPQRNIKTVISLRGKEELSWDEQSLVQSLGLGFVSVPVAGPQDLTTEKILQVRKLLTSANQDDRVLLHCASANRVGAVWWIHRVMDGRMEVELARQEARRVGMRSPGLESAAERLLID